MLLISHRGLHMGTAFAENTLEAFENAVNFGVDGIETDVHLSSDGKLVVFHDRLTPDDQPVEQLTHAQLIRALGYAVPTLEDLLTAWPDLFWNIEIKAPTAAASTFRALEALHNKDRCLVTSFKHDVIATWSRQSDVACGLLFAHRPRSLGSILHDWKDASTMRTLVWDFDILNGALLDEASKRGYRNFSYGAVSVDEHRLCGNWPLDGLITDYPDRYSRG